MSASTTPAPGPAFAPPCPDQLGPSAAPFPGPIDPSYRLVPAFEPSRPYGWTGSSTNGARPSSRAPGDSEDEAEGEEDEEWDWSEDEELVTLDLGRWGREHGGGGAATSAAGDSSQMAITALETATPWLQRGQVVYKGQWVRMMGTEILLERTRDLEGNPSMRPLPQRRATAGEPSTTRSRILFSPATPVAGVSSGEGTRRSGGKPVFPHVQAPQGGRIDTDGGGGSPSGPAGGTSGPSAPPKKRIDGRTYAQDWMAKVESVLERREVLYARGELPANGKMRMSQSELARRRSQPPTGAGTSTAPGAGADVGAAQQGTGDEQPEPKLEAEAEAEAEPAPGPLPPDSTAAPDEH